MVVLPDGSVTSVPYINVIDSDTEKPRLQKRLKLYDFSDSIPERIQQSMITRQMRRVGAKTGLYEELHAMFYPTQQAFNLAA